MHEKVIVKPPKGKKKRSNIIEVMRDNRLYSWLPGENNLKYDLSVCPACGTRTFFQILSVKRAPISCQKLYKNLENAKREKIAILDIVVCETCSMIWNKAFVSDASEHYDNDYYCSFTISEEAKKYQCEQVKMIEEVVSLKKLHVVEIGSGDGFFLEEIAKKSASALGFEPSSTANFSEFSNNVTVIKEFFDFNDARPLKNIPDLIVMRHVLEHIPSALKSIKDLLINALSKTKDPYLFLEIPNSETLLEQNLYFDFYNDHVHYFSKPSLAQLLNNAGWSLLTKFKLKDEFLGVLAKKNNAHETSLNYENESHIRQIVNSAKKFRDEFDVWRKSLLDLLVLEKEKGNCIAVWGAGSRGVSLLAGLELPMGFFEFVVDKDKNKHGKYTPITHLKVTSPNEINKKYVDIVVVTSFTYFNEIIKELKQFISEGGKVIRIYPKPEVFQVEFY